MSGTPDISRPRGQVASEVGLEQRLLHAYSTYQSDLAHFDLKQSTSSYPMRVADQMGAALPGTIALLGRTSVLSWIMVRPWQSAWLAVDIAPAARRLPPRMMVRAAPSVTMAMLRYLLRLRAQLFPLGGGDGDHRHVRRTRSIGGPWLPQRLTRVPSMMGRTRAPIEHDAVRST